MKIRSIDLYRLEAKLLKPYHTAFGDLAYFDAVVALLRTDTGAAAGESTAVQGYSWEGPEDVWSFVREIGPKLVGLEVEEGQRLLRPFRRERPFGVTPLATALEALRGDFPLPVEEEEFPLVGTLNVTRREEIPDELERLLEQGYTTIKFKIGFNLEEDIRKVQAIQAQLEGRGMVRLDANQSYSLDEAVRFVQAVRPTAIELLEQPFAEDDWESMRRFAPLCPLPLMLDESIYRHEDVERAARGHCADYLKLKLMKAGDLQGLCEQARLVLDNGMKLVIGNGAATDISCYKEIQAALNLGLTSAGEMNGYLKLEMPLCREAAALRNGKAVIKPVASLLPDEAALNGLVRDRLTLSR